MLFSPGAHWYTRFSKFSNYTTLGNASPVNSCLWSSAACSSWRSLSVSSSSLVLFSMTIALFPPTFKISSVLCCSSICSSSSTSGSWVCVFMFTTVDWLLSWCTTSSCTSVADLLFVILLYQSSFGMIAA